MIFIGNNQIETIKVGVSDCSIYLAETKVYPEGTHDYSQDYFTTVALGSGDISLSGSNTANTFSYSTDNGSTWSTPSQVNTVPVSNGDKVMWKGEATPDTNGIGKFSTKATTANFNVEGNAMSLLYGDNFEGQTDLTGKSYAFRYLFSGNTHVLSAENLVLQATTLASTCYGGMFGGCTSLTTAPKLPATTLTSGCYNNMFSNCASLTTAPELPATTLASSCYSSMLRGTSITVAPELPATTLADSCYQSMFRDCTHLATAPQLPATTLTRHCYSYMLRGTSITEAPELPATTLASSCYAELFRGCASLTTAPELPATTLAQSCYNSMFSGCTNLNSITCLATDISATSCTTDWTANVAPSGTFYKASAMEDWVIDSDNGIPVGWTVKNYGEKDYSQEYFTTVALADGIIRFAGSSYQNTLSYSKDEGQTWTQMTSYQYNVPVSNGDRVLWKGTPTIIANSGIGTFADKYAATNTVSFNVEGNAMSLLYGDNFQGQTDLTGKNYAFERLFSGNTHIVSAENLILPVTTLSSHCYQSMFNGCTSLTAAPELPATTLAVGCYKNMFNGCTSLTAAPELPATTLAEGCYDSMLDGCTSLTTAPELHATTLASYCYSNMFYGCTSLTAAPELHATTLADYCYGGMFYGCTSLNSITCLATDISATDCTKNWLIGVASTGTFTKASTMTSWPSGTSGIPDGWTVVDA